MWFNLKHAGSTAITVRHHVRNGTIKALEEARDGIIPNLQAQLNELTWGLVNHVNAYQYSGYGIGGDITTTGVGVLHLNGVETVVLDEADEMLDLGFLEDVERILAVTPRLTMKKTTV